MAIMFPESITRTGTSQSAKDLFEKLQKLPDDHVIYFNEILSSRKKNTETRIPDFVIISPTYGLILIAIEGLTAGQITRIDEKYWYFNSNGKREYKHVSPHLSILNYLESLIEFAAESDWAHEILSSDKIKFSLPVHSVVILSQISLEKFNQSQIKAIESPQNNYILLEDIKNIYTSESNSIIELLINKSDSKSPNSIKLSDDHKLVLCSLINPNLIIEKSYIDEIPEKSNSINESIDRMDIIQEKNSLYIGVGHRIIKGVAGSGKTIIITARAKLLAKKGYHILVLCFNRCLASYLSGRLEKHENVEIYNFDRWAKVCGVQRREGETYLAMGERLYEMLETGTSSEFRKYDAILIDEGQDFAPSFYKCVTQALKDPEDGELLIVFDPNQGLYRMGVKGGSTWKECGIKAKGRIISSNTASSKADWSWLGKNYRNTKEIAELANEFAWFLKPQASLDIEENSSEFTIDIAKCIRFGEKPLVVSSSSFQDECMVIERMVLEMLENTGKVLDKKININGLVRPSDITILYPGLPSRKTDRDFFNTFRASLNKKISNLLSDKREHIIWLTNPSNDNSLNRVFDYGLKIQTINSAKGLQNKVVIIMAAHLISDANLEEGYKKLYVGITRPEDYLVISYSDQGTGDAPTKFLQTLKKSSLVEFRNRSHKSTTKS